MENYHDRGKTARRGTGAKVVKNTDKKKRHIGRAAVLTKLGERSAKIVRVKGGKTKVKLKYEQMINVSDGGTTKTVKVMDVLETPSNRQYARRKIITKGAIVETEMGKVKVTSRPGQIGIISGVLLK